MSRYEVVFSARALESLRQVTRYVAEEAGPGRATDWLARVTDSTVTLETHPYFEGEVRHVLTREVSDYLRAAEFPERADALAATTVASDSEWVKVTTESLRRRAT